MQEHMRERSMTTAMQLVVVKTVDVYKPESGNTLKVHKVILVYISLINVCSGWELFMKEKRETSNQGEESRTEKKNYPRLWACSWHKSKAYLY